MLGQLAMGNADHVEVVLRGSGGATGTSPAPGEVDYGTVMSGCYTPVANPGTCQVMPSPVAPSNSALAGTPELLEAATLTPLNGTRRFYNYTYKLRLEHDLAPAHMIYGMASTGFLPGDVQVTTASNAQGQTIPVARVYQENTLTAFEAGSKNRFLGDTLQLNGDVYFYRYGGLQQAVQVNANNPGSAVLFAVPERFFGVELESVYQLTRNDRIGLGYGYSDAYYVDKPADFAALIPESHLGSPVPSTAVATYDHTMPFIGGSTRVLHGDARLYSRRTPALYSNTVLAEGGGAYDDRSAQLISDFNVTWTSPADRYSATAYVRNAGDNRYITAYSVQSLPPFGPQNVTASQYDPRTYGVRVAARW